MVVRVVWRVREQRMLLLWSLHEVWYKYKGIKIKNLWTIASMKLLDCYVKPHPDEYSVHLNDLKAVSVVGIVVGIVIIGIIVGVVVVYHKYSRID